MDREISSFAEIVLILFLVCSKVLLQAQTPFACDGRFFMSVANHSRDASNLYQGRQLADGNIDFTAITIDNPQGHNLNALGFSMRDNLIYGFDPNTYEVFRIDATGKVETIRAYPELGELGYEFAAGEMDRVGGRIMMIGRSGEPAVDKKVVIIRLDRPNDPPGLMNVQTDIDVRLDDFAVDPITGVTYGFDSINKRLVTVGLGTTFSVFSHEFTTISNVGQIGSIFFDQAGNLYGYGSSSGETDAVLFHFDKYTGKVLETFNGPQSGFSSDGCGCPYQIKLEKDIQPRQIIGCGEIVITYTVVNESGSGRSGIHLRDSLPADFVITEIESNIFLSAVNSGVGTNVLDLTNLGAPIGTFAMRIHVQVPADYLGQIQSQATVDNLLLAFGTAQVSDDPFTLTDFDPTTFTVVRPEDIELESQLTQLCDGDTATLQTPLIGNQYLWSTGANTPSISIYEAGTYWLEVTGDCFTYQDTIILTQSEQALTLNLGMDTEIRSGDSFNFNYQTTASGDLSFHWETSSEEVILNCYDCSNPIVTPAQEASYQLTITDEFGCVISDSIRIKVTKSDRFYLATAFSPNGDGHNDFFFIQGKVLAKISTLRVFNRWGTLVHESKGGDINKATAGWNGNINGQPAENGIYLWYAQVKFPDGSTEILSGDVALIR